MPNRSIYLQIIALSWLVGKLISCKLWLAERLYPVVPVFNFTDDIPPLVHTMLYAVSLLCLAALAVKPTQKLFLPVLLVSELLSCVLDVTRWQPWEYQYLFMGMACITNKEEKNLRAILVFILASLYIFSGLQKCNGGFLYTVWDEIILVRFFGLEGKVSLYPALHYAGLSLPVMEILAGVGLMLSKKRWPALLLIAMHSLLLLMLGPVGLNTNVVVWPWNLALIALLYVLFLRQPSMPIRFSFLRNKWNYVPLLFLGVLPVGGLVGYWDQYLSGGLYSGKTLYMSICLENSVSVPEFDRYITKAQRPEGCPNRLKVHDWALKELKVVPYPEIWYYKRLKEQWTEKYDHTGTRFVTYKYPYKEYTPL